MQYDIFCAYRHLTDSSPLEIWILVANVEPGLTHGVRKNCSFGSVSKISICNKINSEFCYLRTYLLLVISHFQNENTSIVLYIVRERANLVWWMEASADW